MTCLGIRTHGTIASILIFFCLTATALAEEVVRVSAGAAPLENIFKKIQEPFQTASGIKLILTKATHVTSIEDVDQGKADIASVAFSFDEWFKRAEKDGLKLTNAKAEFKYRVVGKDNLAFISHPDVNVTSLSQEQLKAIFMGTESSWSKVGGPDETIKPVYSSKLPAFNGLFKERVLQGADFGASVTVIAGEIPDIKAWVKKTKGSIAFVPGGAIDSGVDVIKGPEIGRPVTVISKGPPSQNVLKLYDFIAKEGPKYIN